MKAIINSTYLKIICILLSSILFDLSCEAQNRIKKTDYEYDLVIGSVKQVTYQANRPEVFVQQYKYDADNRIIEVRSSTDGVIFNRDAAYSYYQHGPLSRTVLGDNNVQGLDYVYTIHGWLKAVNSNVLDPSKDPGKDGQIGLKLARDVVGYSLGYYQNDYTSIGGSMQFLSIITPTDLDVPGSSLYNGNIRHMITSLTDNTGTQLDVQGNAYRYDQLNRIKQSELFVLNKVTNSFAGAGPSTKYKENFSYDANGNITGLTRNGNAATRLMDQLTYRYAEEGGKKVNNRLLHVKDDALTATYSNDINDQGTYAANDVTTWNYRYDAIGNLIYDRQSGIEDINWNVGGKIKSIHGIVDSARSDIEFKYDALGHRIAKIVKPFDHLTDPSFWIYTYYILDAKGNTLAAYEKKFEGGELKIRLKEQYTYGSKRLGSVQRDLDVTDPYLPMPNATPTFERILGKRQYELSNHLGNVLAVISDKRTAHITPGGVPDYYLAQVSSATDYYAFGSAMPGRDFNSTNYRYGFNGMEKDNEVKGNGNSYDFGARIYDSRLGRWLSVDPLAVKFEGWSPYNYTMNNPIYFIDKDGKAPVYDDSFKRVFGSYIKKFTAVAIYKDLSEKCKDIMVYLYPTLDGSYGSNGGGKIYVGGDAHIGMDAIVLFSTMIHEMKHNELRESEQTEHEILATSFFDAHVQALKEYDKNNGVQHTEEFYKAVAWGGLEETKAWAEHGSNKKEHALLVKIQKTMEAKTNIIYYTGLLTPYSVDVVTLQPRSVLSPKAKKEIEKKLAAAKKDFDQNIYDKYIAPIKKTEEKQDKK